MSTPNLDDGILRFRTRTLLAVAWRGIGLDHPFPRPSQIRRALSAVRRLASGAAAGTILTASAPSGGSSRSSPAPFLPLPTQGPDTLTCRRCAVRLIRPQPGRNATCQQPPSRRTRTVNMAVVEPADSDWRLSPVLMTSKPALHSGPCPDLPAAQAASDCTSLDNVCKHNYQYVLQHSVLAPQLNHTVQCWLRLTRP